MILLKLSNDSMWTLCNLFVFRSKKMQIIHEEASENVDEEEEEEGSETGSSDDDSNEFIDEDIEHLLAPQEQSQKNEWVPFSLLGGQKLQPEIHLTIQNVFSEKRTREMMRNAKVEYHTITWWTEQIFTTLDSFAHFFVSEISDMVEIFRVETNKSRKMDHLSDSEEFDHFYD